MWSLVAWEGLYFFLWCSALGSIWNTNILNTILITFWVFHYCILITFCNRYLHFDNFWEEICQSLLVFHKIRTYFMSLLEALCCRVHWWSVILFFCVSVTLSWNCRDIDVVDWTWADCLLTVVVPRPTQPFISPGSVNDKDSFSWKGKGRYGLLHLWINTCVCT